MFISIITILVVLIAAGAVWDSKSSPWSDGGAILATIAGGSLMVLFIGYGLSHFKWKPSGDTLTGYVYQRNERYGYADFSLRFSQNAGTDSQPSFCVKAGSEEDKKITPYVGTDTKVQISVPAKGPHFGGFWECSSFAQLDKIIKEEK